MRVLVSTTPGWGHVAPVLPFADELRRQGHRLVWVTAADAQHRLVDRGFDVQVHGMALGERLPRAGAALAPHIGRTPPALMRAHAFSTHFALLAAPAAIEGVRAVATSFRPDVIVREPSELASAAVAGECGVPVVTVGFGGVVPVAARRMADEALAPLFASTGVTVESDQFHGGDLYLHPMPASLDQEPLLASARRVRPPDATPAVDAARNFDDLGCSRSAVYVTFGTEFGPSAPWLQVVAAIAQLDVDAVLTTGAAGLPSGLDVPANIRVTDYVEQHEILGQVSAVVSHAGSGTFLGAAVRGVPQVCIPLGADHFENTGAAVARGIAVGIAPGERDVETLRDAIANVLTDRSMADAAREVRDEIAEAAGPSDAVDWIEGLVSSRQVAR